MADLQESGAGLPLPVHVYRSDAEGPDRPTFAYWSFTKTALAVSALRLVEQGVLSLDRPLPGHAHTLRQLLAHTSGLPDYGSLPAYHAAVAAGEEPWPRARLVSAAMAQGTLFPPGQGWAYSNVGYLHVRALLEEATGLPLATVIQEQIVQVLGLKTVRLAETADEFLAVRHATGSYHPGWVYHGCLIGSGADAVRLLDGLCDGRLMGPEMMAAMQDVRPLGGALPGRPWTETGYGLGLMIGRMGAAGRVLGHSGSGPGSVAAVYRLSDGGLTVAAFAEGCDIGRVEAAVAAAVGQAA